MKRITLIFVALLAPLVAHAAVPGFLPYSGRLTDGTPTRGLDALDEWK